MESVCFSDSRSPDLWSGLLHLPPYARFQDFSLKKPKNHLMDIQKRNKKPESERETFCCKHRNVNDY